VIALGTTKAFITAKNETQSTNKDRRKDIIMVLSRLTVGSGYEHEEDTTSWLVILLDLLD
jgi:hypothetical protein